MTRLAWLASGLAVGALVASGVVAAACGSSGSNDNGSSGFPPNDAGGGPSSEPPVCTGAQTACGAACVDTASDPANCGACGAACAAGELCCAAVCNATAACSFAIASMDPATVNQNGGDWVHVHGTGFVAGMTVTIAGGAAPVLVLDPQTALVQTPPAPVGAAEVVIASGAQTATARGALRYESGGLLLPWQEKPMQVVRGEIPALAVMQDGRVLIAGGTTVPDDDTKALASAEIYTRSTDVVTPAANAMSVPRWRDLAVTLLSGKVLVAGGVEAGSTSADLFDPTTNTFAPASHPMSVARTFLRGVLMTDGRVILTSTGVTTAEIYDPVADSFTAVPMLGDHSMGFMVRLRDGRVMIGGGDGGITAVELFDPKTNTFKQAAPLKQGRSLLTAHTLPDGRVIVLGGASLSAGGIHVPLAEIELYDPAADAWTIAPYALSIGRTWHASALVRDGTIIVAGGYTVDGQCSSLTNTVDQVDPIAGTVKTFGQLPHPNCEWSAVTLLDGSILGVGGGACGTQTALPDIDFLPGQAVR